MRKLPHFSTVTRSCAHCVRQQQSCLQSTETHAHSCAGSDGTGKWWSHARNLSVCAAAAAQEVQAPEAPAQVCMPSQFALRARALQPWRVPPTWQCMSEVQCTILVHLYIVAVQKCTLQLMLFRSAGDVIARVIVWTHLAHRLLPSSRHLCSVVQVAYEAVIGIETHVQLRTKSKAFCACANAYGAAANSHVCPTCTGAPGALPTVNEEVARLGVLAGLALNCNIAQKSKFDRKQYFYPDLPKGYQISQYDEPLCGNGTLEVQWQEEEKQGKKNKKSVEDQDGWHHTVCVCRCLCVYNCRHSTRPALQAGIVLWQSCTPFLLCACTL